MLEPILQLVEEPIDPAVVLLGDALPPLYSARSTISATSTDFREELALAALDEVVGGTGVADAIDNAAAEAAAEDARRRAAEESAKLKALQEEASKAPPPPTAPPR